MKTQKLTFAEALNQALRQEMWANERVFVFGEDVSILGGRYGVTRGIREDFGPNRIFDCPLNEELFVSIAIGASQFGYIPVVEFMYSNFLMIALSDIFRAGIWNFENNGRMRVPMVIRAPFGNFKNQGSELSGDYIQLFYNLPGLAIIVPSSARQAKGLLTAALRYSDPVLFFEHEALYFQEPEDVIEDAYTVPIGKAELVGCAVRLTIVTYGFFVSRIAGVIRKFFSLEEIGIIDIFSIRPIDWDTIFTSARQTGKVLVIEEGWTGASIGADIYAKIKELDPSITVTRIGCKNEPLPYGDGALSLLPTDEEITTLVQSLLND